MDFKSLQVLELPKILDRLSKHTSFSAGAELALALTPTGDLAEARRRQQETTEARQLLANRSDLSVGGARDVRAYAQAAARGGVLLPLELLEIKSTLEAARRLRRLLVKMADRFPRLNALAAGLEEIPGLIEAISRTLDERGEVLDSASETMALIRRDLRLARDRLLQKLEHYLNDPRCTSYLQETIITQRDGRYVIPIKADFKGRIRGIIHDQSASGATLFIEPLATVELNNAWREKQLAEEQEIRRILAALSALVGEHVDCLIRCVARLAALDLAFAKAKYAETLGASEPVLKDFRTADRQKSPAQDQSALSAAVTAGRPPAQPNRQPGSTIKLRQARHPLLNPETVVPIDVELDEAIYALVLTGPNTGGKTVSLKTMGLLALMAQCGLHIPAQAGSELSVFHDVFADIGDEQSIEQSLSTFSAHITNTIRILNAVDEHSLVILDELGAGTDPAEGSALARAILSYLLDMGATTLVATHYPELKGYAQTTPGACNASVEFDLETLAPTYHLTIGLPGRSNAFAIAARLGLDPTIIAEARTMVAPASLEVESLLDEIHRQRETIRAERARLTAARTEAEVAERRLAERLERIEDERRAILERTRAEAQSELDALRAAVQNWRHKLKEAQTAPAAAARQTAEEVEAELEKAERQTTVVLPPAADHPARPIRVGDTVKLKALNSIGVVTAIGEIEAEVQVGRLRIRVKPSEVEWRGGPADIPAQLPPGETAIEMTVRRPAPGMELDIRGRTVDEVLTEVERYIDAAYYAGLPWVRIIHGKGSGRLRQSVRAFLKASPLVKSHARGKEEEGGDGVTIAQLAI